MFCCSQNLKCQDLPKFQFSRGGVGSVPEQSVLAKLSTNFAMPLTMNVETKIPCIAHSGGEIWLM